MKFNRSAGFTLIELLVSLTIFSLLVGMAMYSFRYFGVALGSLQVSYAEQVQKITHLHDCVGSMDYYVGERPSALERSKNFFYLFRGTPREMTFVSSRPFNGTGMALCRILQRNDQVIVEEAPIHSPHNNYQNPTLDTKDRTETVLFSDVRNFSLVYAIGTTVTDTLSEKHPELITITVETENRTEQHLFRVRTNFTNKKDIMRAIHEPI
jgi:prepilin-type N-terminal cleavage/methylation domain-containing protein